MLRMYHSTKQRTEEEDAPIATPSHGPRTITSQDFADAEAVNKLKRKLTEAPKSLAEVIKLTTKVKESLNLSDESGSKIRQDLLACKKEAAEFLTYCRNELDLADEEPKPVKRPVSLME